MNHKLEYVEKNPWVGGYDASCSCSDPDWVDDGWDGQVVFHGATVSEVEDYFADHVAEAGYV